MATRDLTLRISGDPRSLSQAFRQVDNDAGRMERTFSRVGRNMAALGKAAAAAAATAGAAFAGLGIKEAIEQEKVAARTANVLKTTGGVANVTAKQVENLAAALQRQTGTADDAIQSGANLILTFTGIRNEVGKGNDIFDQTVGIVNDISVALGQGMKESSIQVGKALNDPIKGVSALQRVGVSFTQQQKDQIKAMVEAGDTLGAQKLILSELNTEFAGAAKSEGAVTEGWQALQRAAEDAAEAVMGRVLPALTELASWARTEVVPRVQEIAEVVGPVLGHAFEQAIPIIRGMVEQVGSTIRRLAPIVGPVLRQLGETIRSVLDLIAAFWERWGDDILAGVRRVFRALAPVILPILKALQGAIETITALIEGRWADAFGSLKGVAVNLLKGVFAAVKGLAGLALSAAKALGQAVINGIVGVIKGAATMIWNAIKAILPSPSDIVDFLNPFGGGGVVGPATQQITRGGRPFVSRLRGPVPTGPLATRQGGGAVGGPMGTPVPILAHAGEVVLNPAQQRIIGIDRIMSTLRATGGVMGGGSFQRGGVIDAALSFARAQVGEPYVWGGGHALGDFSGWDCSGFASNVAARVPGYTGGIGTTMSLFPKSRPARGNEPVVFGFRGMGTNNPRSQHMGIRIGGVWFDAGSGGVETGDSRWEALRVPPGLEGLAAGNGPDPGPGLAPDQPTGPTRAQLGAAGLIGAVARAGVRAIGAGTTLSGAGSERVAGRIERGGELRARGARITAEAKARKSGAEEDEIREAGDRAYIAARAATLKRLKAQLIARRKKLVARLRRIRKAIRAVRVPRRGPARQPARDRLVDLRRTRQDIEDEISTSNFQIAEYNVELRELGQQVAALDRADEAEEAEAAAEAAETAAQVAAEVAEAAAAEAAAAPERAVAEAALTPGLEDDLAAAQMVEARAVSAYQAAHATGSNIRIAETARALASARSAREAVERQIMEANTKALQENTGALQEATQTWGGSVAFSFRGQSQVLRSLAPPSSDRLTGAELMI